MGTKLAMATLQNNSDRNITESFYFFVGKTDTTITFAFLPEASYFLFVLALG
ncbi:MAG TPA: hypothetical protein PLJ60_15990 [Chryseolinea sp.]|nr:hypothetical protein [Chryseolinea sp.]